MSSEIVIIKGREFHNTLEGKGERFEVLEKGPWGEGVDYRSRHVILTERETGKTFMGFEAEEKIDGIWKQVQNEPDTRYTMRQAEKIADTGWIPVKVDLPWLKS